jgi:thiamine biosynthesis lipoprotein ApbE
MNTKIRSITILVFILFLITVIFFSVIRKQPIEYESGYRLVMGTFARVIIVAQNSAIAEKAAEDAFAAIERVDNLMSDFKDDSDI